MELGTLQHIDIEELVTCYNEAFSDYIVPVQVTIDSIKSYMSSRRVKTELSVGAFEDGRLVGFILTGVDRTEKTLISYNAGTGVIPRCRGSKITQKLYSFLLPLLRKNGITNNLLEVILGNERAIHIYQSLGYAIIRELWCYKGNVKTEILTSDLQVKPLELYDWGLMKSFWDWQPSWQHDINAVDSLFNENISIGAYDNGQLVGYLVYNPAAKRVFQFAVSNSYRRKGIATQLFLFIANKHSTEMSVINVDNSLTSTIAFLENIGLSLYTKQFEMNLQV